MLHAMPVGRRFSDTLYLAPGVSSSGSAGRANPSILAAPASTTSTSSTASTSPTGYGALGSLLDRLRLARQRDAVRLHQGSPGQDRRLRGGVRPVDRRRRQRRDQERQQRAARLGLRLRAAERPLEGTWKTFQSANGTVNTVDHGALATPASRPAARSCATKPVLLRRHQSGLGDAHVHRAATASRCRASATSTASGRTLSYSAKGTYQLAAAHRFDASFFGDPSQGRRSGRSALRRCSSTAHVVVQRAEFGGHNQTLRYDGVLARTWLLEASFARAVQPHQRSPADRRVARDRHHGRDPTRITGGIGFYEEGNESLNNQFTVKAT